MVSRGDRLSSRYCCGTLVVFFVALVRVFDVVGVCGPFFCCCVLRSSGSVGRLVGPGRWGAFALVLVFIVRGDISRRVFRTGEGEGLRRAGVLLGILEGVLERCWLFLDGGVGALGGVTDDVLDAEVVVLRMKRGTFELSLEGTEEMLDGTAAIEGGGGRGGRTSSMSPLFMVVIVLGGPLMRLKAILGPNRCKESAVDMAFCWIHRATICSNLKYRNCAGRLELSCWTAVAGSGSHRLRRERIEEPSRETLQESTAVG